MRSIKSLPLQALLAAAALLSPPAMAQTPAFPTKTVKIIVPFAPGGGNDAFARQIAHALTDAWKQPVIVENRPGAGGNIGTAAAASAPADGYTLLLGHTGTLSINPGLYGSKLPYKPQSDFIPVSLVASTPLLLVVNPAVKMSGLSEIVARAKASPNELNYASSGSGTGSHLSGELLKHMAGVQITHISYKGTAPALTDVLGGQVQMMFGVVPTVLPQIKAGKLTAIAVTGKTRLPSLPNVPTMSEAGLPGYESTLAYGILAPKGTPDAIVKEIHTQISKALTTPKMMALLAAEGATPLQGDSAQYAALIKAETEKWGKVIKDANIQVE
jgi:tripartite-type tricarboxylate transporter receptor subunit TctC